MSNTIRGVSGATQNFEEISYTPQTGRTGRWGKEGPKDAIKAMLADLESRGFSYTYKSDQSPKASVHWETPGNIEGGGQGNDSEVPTLVWEYFAGQAEISIIEADLDSSNGTVNLNAMSAAEKKLLLDRTNGQEITSPATPSAGFTSLLNLINQGVRNFRVNIPTLRRSMLVSTNYPVKASLTNVGRIITTATLQIQENIPSTILFNLPSFVTTRVGFAYAWYKKFPNVQQAGGYKWNIAQEWEYGLYPTAMYGTVL